VFYTKIGGYFLLKEGYIRPKDEFAGTITIIFQVVGKTTALMRSLREGDLIRDVVGPLGRPAEVENLGTVVMVGGGTDR
jgi:ferredoxin--NADP+ reductase